MSYNHNQASQPGAVTDQTRSLVYLSSQLSLLTQRTEQLAHLSAVAAEQASYMRLLGAHHAGLFMAAQKVFVPQDDEQEPEHK
ncbi:uncharacterized protein JCM15063_003475 [Sporobolomyces koalae]|uniref:uncharacterized protein n=1 Tax=Sporobolomyces koalae TaxID=500713 RepID=UPI00317D6E28